MTFKPVLCVGIAVMDLVFDVDTLPNRPTKHFATGYREIGGGPAANGAVTVARLGGEAHLWARVGGDDWGRRIVEDLHAEGVNVGAVRQLTGGKSGVSAVLLDNAGERMIVTYRDPALVPDATWLPVEKLSAFGAALADLRWPQAAIHVLQAAQKAGVPGILDADKTDDGVVQAAAEAASHIIYSQPALADWMERDDPAEGLAASFARFGGWHAVTLGQAGVLWTSDGVAVHRQDAFEVATVDTLGAGDVFHGAFAAGLARGHSEIEALRWAAAAAALKCTRHGGRAGIPTGAELEQFLKEQA